MIRSVAALDTAYGSEAGNDVLYTTVNGSPASFQVVDLDNYELLRTFPLPGTTSAWSHTVDPDGNVVIASSGKLFRYSPATKQVEDLGQVPGAIALYGAATDSDGDIIVGTYPDAKVVRWDSATRTYHDLGAVADGQEYVRGMAYRDGIAYAGIGTTGGLWAVDVTTGSKTEIEFPDRPEYDKNAMPQVYGMNLVGSLLFVHLANINLLLVYDTATGTWSDTVVPNFRGLYTSPARDGKTWFTASGRVMTFDLASHEVADTGMAFGTYLRHSAWVEVPDPDLPGVSLVTIQFGGSITFFNPSTGTVKTKPSIVEGQPVGLQSMESGPDGKVYLSGYMGTSGTRLDPADDSVKSFPIGQSEGITALGDEMYFGVYPGATVHRLDTSAPLGSGNPSQAYDIGDHQDRPFAMTSGDGMLFLGTVADYGALDGALTVKDADGWRTYPGVVDDQSVIGVAYRDGVVYGSSSVWGGLGSQPSQTEAHVFAMDAKTGEEIADVVPDLPGDVPAKAIGSLTFGPDGLLWGAAWGTIFAMDPDTLKVVKSREIYPTDWNFGHLWRPVALKFGSDGQLYTTLGTTLTVVDPKKLKYRKLADEADIMTLGADGHVYYAAGTDLMRLRTDR
ncbi:MAG: hypothetical protein ACRDTU_10090 [Micromonosporaceae bacterium]